MDLQGRGRAPRGARRPPALLRGFPTGRRERRARPAALPISPTGAARPGAAIYRRQGRRPVTPAPSLLLLRTPQRIDVASVVAVVARDGVGGAGGCCGALGRRVSAAAP